MTWGKDMENFLTTTLISLGQLLSSKNNFQTFSLVPVRTCTLSTGYEKQVSYIKPYNKGEREFSTYQHP